MNCQWILDFFYKFINVGNSLTAAVIKTPITDTLLLRKTEILTVLLRRSVSVMGCFWENVKVKCSLIMGEFLPY